MKQRLEAFLNAEGITKAQFADSINVARAAISHIFAGRNNPSYDFILNTMKAYPSLNIEWLLNGTGAMYKDGYEPAIQPDVFSRADDDAADLFSSSAQEDIELVEDSKQPDDVIEPTAESIPVSAPAPAPTSVSVPATKESPASIKRIVVYFTDGTYKDYIPD